MSKRTRVATDECNHKKRCPVCKGAGEVWITEGCNHSNGGEYRECASCHGTGKVHDNGCCSPVVTYYPNYTWYPNTWISCGSYGTAGALYTQASQTISSSNNYNIN